MVFLRRYMQFISRLFMTAIIRGAITASKIIRRDCNALAVDRTYCDCIFYVVNVLTDT